MTHHLVGAVSALALLAAGPLAGAAPAPAAHTVAQPAGFGPAPKPTGPGAPVQYIKVHGKSLEGNLEGDAVDRDVLVVLPPSYARSPQRRYPVIYFLHGFGITADYFSAFLHVPEASLASSKKGAEFIIVVPDTDTKMGGSMYSSSATTGDFETFIARDLVSYVDSHYRTIAKRSSRGLAGHSMGGYGTWKVAMDHPQMWGSIYAMSACCLSARKETADSAQKMSALTIDQATGGNFGVKAGVASMVAWSPDPKNPPFYADFPYKDGAIDQSVLDRWAANAPLVMASAHIPELKSFTAVAADGGDKDGLTKDATRLHEELDLFGVANSFEVYDGNHVNRIAERFEAKVLPFFAKHLVMK
jgi:enterochelin esterase-like enzyme